MEKINSKVKSYIKVSTRNAQEQIGLLQKATDVVLELDKLNLEASYIKEKPHKVVISVGKYNNFRPKISKFAIFLAEKQEKLLKIGRN